MSVNSTQGIYETRTVTVTSDGTGVSIYQRVYVAATGVVTVAGATDDADFIAMQPIAANFTGAAMPIGGGGTRYFIASGAITAGAKLYSAAAGALSATAGSGHLVGKAWADTADTQVGVYVPISEAIGET